MKTEKVHPLILGAGTSGLAAAFTLDLIGFYREIRQIRERKI